MRKSFILLSAIALFATQMTFADTTTTPDTSVSPEMTMSPTADTAANTMMPTDDTDSQSCGKIAQACKTSGFVDGTTVNKTFWQDCMWPVLQNKSVSGVTIESKDVTACRDYKINKMKNELNILQHVSSNH